MPPSGTCAENTSVRDEVWDQCIKRSSLTIGLGTLLGGVASIFMGTGGVVFSIGLCTALAMNNCRSLFREQNELKNVTPAMPKPSKEFQKKDKIDNQAKKKKEKTTEKVKKEKKQAAEFCTKDKKEKSSKVNYSFPSLFPIPDRAFGCRGKLEKIRCTIIVTDKLDKNQPPSLLTTPKKIQQSPVDFQDHHQEPPSFPKPLQKEEEEFRLKMDMGDNDCECTVERYHDCIHVDCKCQVPKYVDSDQCTCNDNNMSIKCKPTDEIDQYECSCGDNEDATQHQKHLQTITVPDDHQEEAVCTCP